MILILYTFLYFLKFFCCYTTDQEALPGSPSLPASFQSHPKPLSPLVHRHQRGDGLPSSESLSPTVPLSSPSRVRRRRHLSEEDDHQQNKVGPELSPFDTASIISMPSMLSLHSHVEGIASWHEEKDVHNTQISGMFQKDLWWSPYISNSCVSS